MVGTSMGHGYTSAEVARLLDLSPAQVRGYVKAGFLAPERGVRGEMRFSFQDLVLMRTARALLVAEVPARRVRVALKKLRTQLPEGRPLSGVAIAAEGQHVVVRDGRGTWRPESGQAMFDFAVGEAARAVAVLGERARKMAEAAAGTETEENRKQATGNRKQEMAEKSEGANQNAEGVTEKASGAEVGRRARGRGKVMAGMAPVGADGWYDRGLGLEAGAPEAAREAYRKALELDAEHLDALVNLGRLEHEAGALESAERMYRRALVLAPGDVTAAFNLGVALEDQGKTEAAVTAYRRALAADPGCADAHYNLSRLYERLGRTAAAIRHLSAYRRLTE
jgi:tetratricopeptide (TPR) repeat protein